ncbi:MAG TPA: hypothetical protein VGB70_10250 [Allosphingosinicella sp.]|jgi:hypothetical protein
MRRYLRLFSLSFALCLLAVAGLTRLIDPYGYWGGPEIAGLNRFKPASGKHLRAVKLRQLERVRPATLLVGNSRVAVGLDPEAPEWSSAAYPIYNLGLPGAGTEALVNTAIAAMDRAKPKALVFAPDFVDFRVSLQDWRTRNATNAAGREATARFEAVPLLLSLDALTDSLAAITEQHKANPAHLTPQGFDSLAEYHGIVAAEGHAVLFEQRQRDNIGRYLSGPKAVRWPGSGGSSSWAALERLAFECRKRGVALTLITYPYHVDLLLAFEATGLWTAFEDWHRGLAGFAQRTGTPLYDFSRVTVETTEAVPAPGDTKTRLDFYWEAGHFKAALGRRMIADLGQPAPRFGTRLLPSNVEPALAEKRAALATYRLARRKDAARVDRLFAAVAGRGPTLAPAGFASR